MIPMQLMIGQLTGDYNVQKPSFTRQFIYSDKKNAPVKRGMTVAMAADKARRSEESIRRCKALIIDSYAGIEWTRTQILMDRSMQCGQNTVYNAVKDMLADGQVYIARRAGGARFFMVRTPEQEAA